MDVFYRARRVYTNRAFARMRHRRFTRHEMLHEINGRDVITNLLVWISGVLKKSS